MKILYALILCLFVYQAQAEIEYRDFKQPEQEQAYQTLISELRCLVCQNQTIADSNADLAKDLRRQVYEMLQQGKSRQDIVDFMTDRYGDFVMYKPALKLKTMLLWLGPVLFLVIGLATVWVLRSKTGSSDEQLTKEQQAKLNSILEKGDDA
ncbi:MULTISPECIES: cytochrome c-type biogenesis protein [Methylomonas]|uniref:Cytochrome c-type biogenesis protein n=2 Tax=Methylomonas TaxID=416 RepID=A0A140E6G9_9GAMM|nr:MULTISPECIES: cytochrome c-type biogenesis protein [Methylomonas]AMK78993.1 cytochrome C biogenesis protein CcmH [Methylomonas denitrificans]OAH99152.1 cytochrome C biogenesis protein CcmH [Methylomonas methanica]TCV77484.1 cytochrome c-type biogenesis protein CcmH [Methylomonas methanica]